MQRSKVAVTPREVASSALTPPSSANIVLYSGGDIRIRQNFVLYGGGGLVGWESRWILADLHTSVAVRFGDRGGTFVGVGGQITFATHLGDMAGTCRTQALTPRSRVKWTFVSNGPLPVSMVCWGSARISRAPPTGGSADCGFADLSSLTSDGFGSVLLYVGERQ